MLLFGLDIETTGFEQEKGHRIIEIAMLGFQWDGSQWNRKGSFVRRINPMRPIDPGAQRVHKIALSDLADCPKWEEVAPDVHKLLSAANFVVAHNGNKFDLPFIALEMMRIGIEPPGTVKPIDTMQNARWATATGKLPRLSELCWAMGVEYDPSKAHAALYDVEVMMDCFWKGHADGRFKLEM